MKKKRSLIAGLCSLALAFTMGVSAIGYIPQQTAYAALAENASFTVNDIVDEVDYLGTVTVPAVSDFTAAVTAPNGNAVTATSGSFVAEQLGNYIITYTKGNLKYSFTVYCSAKNDYELKVEKAYSIPTYVKKNDTINLPAATVGFIDEDGEWQAEQNTVTIDVVNAKKDTNDANKVIFENAGSAFITYVAKVGAGSKILTKTFEVKVQEDFEDVKAPTLSVSNVPSSGNTNMAVTLPVATATDTYDANVEVQVTVQNTVNGELTPVKKVTVNDDGIASVLAGAENEVFDNGDNMTFYPTADGDYKVTYQAIDDSGHKSAAWTYTVTVSDKKAPTITVDSTLIPAKWGYKTVKNIADDADKTLSFPMPEFYDNKDEADSVTVEFSIKDPEDKTVVRFANINTTDEVKYTSTVLGKDLTLVKSGDKFTVGELDFNEYIEKVKEDNANYQAVGDYVITYAAKDARGNKSTKTYTVNLVENFEDTEEVAAEFKTYEKNIVLSQTKTVEYTVPTATCSSAVDSSLNIVYTVNGLTVKAGEVLEIKYDGSKYVLYTENDSAEVTDKLTFVVTATSDAGNSKTANAEVTLVSSYANTYNFTDNLTVGTLTADSAKQAIGGYVVIDGVDKQAVGVEVGVMDADSNYLTSVSAEVIYTGDKYVVRNVSFDTTTAGDYYLVIKAFDITGDAKVLISKVTVNAAGSSDDEIVVPRAALNVSSAAVNAQIKFSNTDSLKITNSEITATGATLGTDTIYIAREIKGGRFALIGDTLTAKSEGNYNVVEKFVCVDVSYADAVKNDDFATLLASKKISSSVAVSDTDTVKLEVQDKAMPSYSALNATVEIPTVAAYTSSANASDIEFKVTAPDGTAVTVNDDNSFTPTQNGTYTMTFTVKVGNKEDATFTYTLKAGDLVAPVITVVGSHASSMTAGSEFKYIKISATDANGTDAEKLVYTKTVYGPDGSVVGTQISGTGTTYANKETPTTAFTLDASGKYTVKYEVKDAAGNVAVKEFEITVTSTTGNSGISLAALSTILIVVGVLLIAGVIVYLFRFRRVDKSKKN